MDSWQALNLHEGASPLLISMPHSGTRLTDAVAQGMTPAAMALPDTDWYIPELYELAPSLGVSIVSANYSRYVIDLNRPENDAALYSSKTTGLFPDILFTNKPLFQAGQTPSTEHRTTCKQQVWQPYHAAIAQQLKRIKQQHGYAILLDAHSIAGQVPMLFEGDLPHFNWGTNAGNSCAASMLQVAQDSVDEALYTQVSNGRFKGGYITRHYGQPQQGVHAIQLELSQDAYLQDGYKQGGNYVLSDAKLGSVSAVIAKLLKGLIAWHP